ncbi:lysoplasmalogenase [Cytophagales bacterium LB-30]|uniref:Lysoplasmalogenase n=1 Tax=Shiella aurantiaca TaxID=3058365 RepID=A0ABT8F9I6_9BACT|nr:lysoplasmalogenase [Shiella aurantiaca]MDN4166914.1 lysoplasmalogenase [Shiella aurantiaca]
MKPIKKSLLVAYLLVVILHLYAIIVGDESIVRFTKPILMPLLLAFVMRSLPSTAYRLPLLMGLFFSWLGDILLMHQTDNSLFFVFGLSAFLIAHIAYVWAYAKAQGKSGIPSVYKLGVSLVFLGYAGFFVYQLWADLGEMRIPVTLYALVISAMLSAAAFRLKATTAESFRWVLLGALCFALSDSLLAVNKFSEAIPNASFLIMLTYTLAQGAIAWGMIKYQNYDDAKRVL